MWGTVKLTNENKIIAMANLADHTRKLGRFSLHELLHNVTSMIVQSLKLDTS
jgi:hypothetical protein